PSRTILSIIPRDNSAAGGRPSRVWAWGSVARARRADLWRRSAFFAYVVTALLALFSPFDVAADELPLPKPDPAAPIFLSADAGNRWRLGEYDVWILRGGVELKQDDIVFRGNEAVVWIDRLDDDDPAFSPFEGNGSAEGGRASLDAVNGRKATHRQGAHLLVYFEGDFKAESGGRHPQAALHDRTWYGRFDTTGRVFVDAKQTAGEPNPMPPIFARATARKNAEFDDAVRRTQYLVDPDAAAAESWLGAPTQATGTRRIRVFPRSEVPVQAKWFPNPETNEWIAVIDAGVNLVVDGLDYVGAIDVSADRLVIWTKADQEPDLTGNREIDGNVPLEIYMEGNIVFRQGERVIYADRMYYDVTRNVGIVLNAEMLTPVPNYEGMLRLRASVLRQLDQHRFFGENMFITSSRMGKPGFRLESRAAFVEDVQQPAIDPLTGIPRVDPETGEPVIEHRHWAVSRDNVVYLGDLPVFWWPVLATDLTEPSYYLRRFQMKTDNIYGTQVLTNWDVYQLLGIRNKPEGTDWDLSLDYMSERGFGYGSTFTYSRDRFFGIPG
ncbi:MAG: hypothetical protein D6741_17085, partial [Planctomycetota bacterium]